MLGQDCQQVPKVNVGFPFYQAISNSPAFSGQNSLQEQKNGYHYGERPTAAQKRRVRLRCVQAGSLSSKKIDKDVRIKNV